MLTVLMCAVWPNAGRKLVLGLFFAQNDKNQMLFFASTILGPICQMRRG